MNTAEFAVQFPGWGLVNTGDSTLVARREFTDKDGHPCTVGVNGQSVIVYGDSGGEGRDIASSGRIFAAASGGDLTDLAGLFTAGEIKEIDDVVDWFALNQRA